MIQEQLKALWNDLRSDEGPKAYQAIWKLVRGKQSVPFIQKRFLGKALPPEHIARLLKELDDDQFKVRERASKELGDCGVAANASLKRALQGNPSQEQQRRIEKILAKIKSEELDQVSPVPLDQRRAIQVLEYIGTAEAKNTLSKLADSEQTRYLAEEARSSLDRLEKPKPRQ